MSTSVRALVPASLSASAGSWRSTSAKRWSSSKIRFPGIDDGHAARTKPESAVRPPRTKNDDFQPGSTEAETSRHDVNMPQLVGSHRAACLPEQQSPAVKRECALHGPRNRYAARALCPSGNPCSAERCRCRHLEATRQARHPEPQRRNPGRCRDRRRRGPRSRKGRCARDGNAPRAGL